VITLNLSGELLCDEWAELYRWFGFESGFYCPADIRAAIDKLKPGEDLVLEINSVGGHVDAAAEIYALLEKLSNPTRAEIQSLAASAASYFILACDRVEISLAAQMMIHCGSWSVGGNKFDHLWAAQQLEETDSSILDVYCRKCGEHRREQLQLLMEAESYLSAKKCLELGLVDAIIGDVSEPGTPALVASAHGNTVRAMRTLPDLDELRRRREEQTAQMDEELAAEKARYTM
jgi:ATP-dependent Clp protease protease subunit